MPLVELFSIGTPIRALPPPKIMVLDYITYLVEVDGMVTPPYVYQIAIISGTKQIVDVEDSTPEPIPLVLKILQELKKENQVVRSRLDKQDEMFKEQAETNTKIEGMLHAILTRLRVLNPIQKRKKGKYRKY